MPDKSFSGLPPNINERKAEAVGVRILGEIDSRTLSREVFEQSPELLFHGSRVALNFSQELDYRSEEYLTGTDGSATLGFGFYTTDDKNAALNYSTVRQGNTTYGSLPHPVVTPVLPYQARILDLRNKNDLKRNAPIAKELVAKWREKFWKYLEEKAHREQNGTMVLSAVEADYTECLQELSALDSVDMRVLLGTASSGNIKHSLNLIAPQWAHLFSDFMKEQGYDGLIYNEGGEGMERKDSATYVFYNPQKVGTYESWQAKE